MSGVASSNSMIGQPRLGLAGLDAMQHPDTVHEEVRMRMTATALQLALLATRQVRMHRHDSCLVLPALLCTFHQPTVAYAQVQRCKQELTTDGAAGQCTTPASALLFV
jgi:hypothetical protein